MHTYTQEQIGTLRASITVATIELRAAWDLLAERSTSNDRTQQATFWSVTGKFERQAFAGLSGAEAYCKGLNATHPEGGYIVRELYTADQLRSTVAAAVAKKERDMLESANRNGHLAAAIEIVDALKAELAQRDAHIVEYNARIQAEVLKLLTEKDAHTAELLEGVEMPELLKEDSQEANDAIRAMLVEYSCPANPQNAGRAGWRAARHHFADQFRSTVAAAVLRKDAEIALQKISYFGQMQELLAERDALKANNERLQTQTNERGALAIANGIRMERTEAENERLLEACNKFSEAEMLMKGQP